MTAEELKKQLEEQRRGICPPLGNRLQEAARVPFPAGEFAPGCILSASVIEEAQPGDVVIIRTRAYYGGGILPMRQRPHAPRQKAPPHGACRRISGRAARPGY